MFQHSTPFASGAVIYRGLQNIPIPTDFAGVYLNIDTGVSAFAEFTGWDINPFFGGVGVANSATFQPARTGTANSDAIVALGTDATVNGGLFFAIGDAGSDSHLGSALNQFGIGQEAYLGFRFTTDGGVESRYGWMRVVFTANTLGGVIKDWAYESGGGSIQTGDVLQASPVAGVSVVTLSGGAGTAAALGPLLDNAGAGNTIRVVKTGAGTWVLSGTPAYSELITSDGITNLNASLTNATITADGGTLNVNADAANSTINVNGSGTVNFNVAQTLAELNVGEGGVVELAEATSNFALADAGASASSPVQGVPEPGAAALLVAGFAALLSVRQHGAKRNRGQK